MEVFAAVTGPKQLYRHEVLQKVWIALLQKPKPELVKRALACLATFKLPFLRPYSAQLAALVEDGRMRDQLVLFTLTGVCVCVCVCGVCV